MIAELKTRVVEIVVPDEVPELADGERIVCYTVKDPSKRYNGPSSEFEQLELAASRWARRTETHQLDCVIGWDFDPETESFDRQRVMRWDEKRCEWMKR